MSFEYDNAKSLANRKKHGISFEEAQKLWEDAFGIIFPARVSDEPRWFLIGTIDGSLWTAIFTIRNDNVRIISVSRSRKEEKVIYEKE